MNRLRDLKAFDEAVSKITKQNRDIDPAELQAIVDEAVQEVRALRRKSRKARSV